MIELFEAAYNLHFQGFMKNRSEREIDECIAKAFMEIRARNVEIMFEEFFTFVAELEENKK